MRSLFIILFCSQFTLFAQHEYMQWTTVGAEGDLIGKLDWAGEVNFRFGNNGLETIFPQVGLKYKVTKWFKPSIEYRWVFDKNSVGNYNTSHRINLNGNFKEDYKRLSYGARLRYQYAFTSFNPTLSYNSDFDQAYRIKPFLEYDINNFILTPKVSAEWFYNPINSEGGRRFDKIRLCAGAGLDLNNNHDISFKYQLDKKLHDPTKDLRHVLSVSYVYKF